MDLIPALSGEQQMLLDATTRLLDSSCPIETVRAFADGGPRTDDGNLRRQAAELGWYGLLVEERHGGGTLSGNGVVDAALIAAARGYRFQPGAFVPTSLVAFALSCSDQPAHAGVLDGLVSGEMTAAWAVDGFTRGRASLLHAERRSDGVVLSGKLPAVQDADTCDVVLVTSLHDTPYWQYLVPRDATGLHVRPANGLDLTRRFSEVTFDRVTLPASSAVHGPDGFDTLVEREIDVAAVVSAADAVGAMQRDFDLALEYAKSRVAFGRPIGSFQAIKHLLANCSLWLEMSKAAVAGAARAVGANAPEASALASVAKSYVGERAIELTQSCFQVFGGIGYTWEHDHHLAMRRLGVEAQLFGGPAWHRDRLARMGGLDEGNDDGA